jgi:hypothetical protein
MNWFKKISSNMVQMTPAEKNWADWAIDPMRDYWCDEEGAYSRDGDIYDENQIPKIEGNNLILSDTYEINEDLLYRLEEMSYDVAYCDATAQEQSARCRSAFTLAKKIRGI